MIGVDINMFCYLFINFTWQPNFCAGASTCQLHFAFYHGLLYVYFWQYTLSTSQRWFSELVSEQFSLHSISQNKLGIIPFYLLSVLSATGMIQMPDQICLLLYTNLKKQYVNPKNENVLLNYEYFLRALRTPPVQLLQEGRGHFGHCLYLY